ncbi:acetyl-CoA synthetase-like protein [Colletotrichum tofieldiae]|nr:acetyl-CoA synthetase-like protein [Colletotrichum tofieldiae]
MGVGPEMMVLTCFEKSAWAAVSMLAVIIAGGVGVALHASQPEERLRHIIVQTGARLVLAGVQTAELAQRLAPDVVVVKPTSFEGLNTTLPENPVLSQEQAPSADNALFVVFTSGSTGTPKGAVLTHSGFSSATRY